jgi:hypothetical protein
MAEPKPDQEETRLSDPRELAEAEAGAKIAANRRIADFEAFLKEWPDGVHAANAKARIEELRGLYGIGFFFIAVAGASRLVRAIAK